MKRSFVFNVFFMVLVNLLVKPFWVFGIDRTVQNRLGESEYGLYFAIFNFTYLFQILLDFGLQNYNNREVAADRSRINELLPGILIFKTLLLSAYLFFCVAVAYPIGYLSYSFIWIILLSQILLSFNIYLRSNISAHQLFMQDALLSVLDKLLMILFSAVLIWGHIQGWELTVFNFALAQLLAYAITFLVCLIASFRLVERPRFRLHWQDFGKIAKETLPYAVIHFLMTTYYRIDGVMLEQLREQDGALQSGIYAQGYRIMESLNNIGYLFASILLPLFAYRLSTQKDVHTLLKSSFSIMFCVSVPLILGFYSYRVDIMDLLYHASDIHYSAEVFAYLLLNFFPVALLYVIGTLLTANRNFIWMIGSLVIAVLLNIGLNWLLIRSSGAKGAGQATLITQCFMLLSYGLFTLRHFRISFSTSYLLRLLVFAALCYGSMEGLRQWSIASRPLPDMALHLAIFLVLVPVWAFITGLVQKQTLQLRVGLEE